MSEPSLPDLAPQDAAILERRIRPLVRPELVAEHRARPLGPHSAALGELLVFLRRNVARNRPRCVLIHERRPPGWRLAIHPSLRGSRFVPVEGAVWESREEAEHAVFLRRLDDLGLAP